jgi:hypothetical protein
MKRGRFGILAVMIVCLLAASVLRQQSLDWQLAQSGRTALPASGGVGQLNSFALALVLGGLRGPLVIYLWTSSESQKNERNLEDFDTKLEWIRLLQPEFDTVHLFQMWNKAYNVSVLLASPADKYTCIMQALEYGESVLKEKPGDMNILAETGNIYSIKLGGHAVRPEQKFYNRQLCEESMTDANRKLAFPDDAHFSRLWQGSRVLDDHNNILPELLAPTRPRPAEAAGDWNDGSTLQYLARFQPFPYGICPGAMAYNYAKRAQIAQTVDGQKPLQVSAMVIDSRPAIELEQWMLETASQGRLAEAHAFDIAVPDEGSPQPDVDLSGISPTAKPVEPRAFQAAIDQYTLAARLSRDALDELERHLKNPDYEQRISLYASHIDDVQAAYYLRSADRDYLMARNLPEGPARQLRQQTVANYQHGIAQCERILLTFYTPDEVLHGTFPSEVTKEKLAAMSDAAVAVLYDRSIAISSRLPASQFDDERGIYIRDITRASARLKLLAGH